MFVDTPSRAPRLGHFESGTHLNMSRSHARSPRGERAYSKAPHHPGERPNLIAALSTPGIQAPWLVSGSVDTEAFTTLLEQILWPTLFPGQTVILDNYSVHKYTKIQALNEASECTLLFLPTCLPDLMPTENTFSKIKALPRKAQAATQETLSYTSNTLATPLTCKMFWAGSRTGATWVITSSARG